MMPVGFTLGIFGAISVVYSMIRGQRPRRRGRREMEATLFPRPETLMPASLLIVEDAKPVVTALEALLADYLTTVVSSSLQAVKILDSGMPFDAVLCELEMPSLSGLDVLQFIKRQKRPTEFVAMTKSGSVRLAVAAIQAGAVSCLAKPLDHAETRAALRLAIDRSRLNRNRTAFRNHFDGLFQVSPLYGDGPAIREARSRLENAAIAVGLNVLVRGEPGTGRELAARAIHEQGDFRSERFVSIDCEHISVDMLIKEISKLELDGKSVGGSENQSRGTLFLHEIGALSADAQVLLCRFLNQCEFSVAHSAKRPRYAIRVIASTSQDLASLAAAGQFRDSLLYRVSALQIDLPPLRNRVEDIGPLAEAFIDSMGMRSKIERISPQALRILEGHPWPGNVLELRNCISFAATMSFGPQIEPDDLPDLHGNEPTAIDTVAGLVPRFAQLNYNEAIELGKENAARAYLNYVIEETGGNVTEAARRAGIERASLHRALKRHRIDPNAARSQSESVGVV